MIERKNCWEVMKCGRQPEGENIKSLGVCKAALSNEYDGTNKGKHGGRFCWAIAGTLCEGEPDGVFAKKITSCVTQCGFYKHVEQEESSKFVSSHTLLERCGESIQDLMEL